MPIYKDIGNDRLAAIEWASKKLDNSIDRPNMNSRGISEALDDKIMGDVATIAVCKYLREVGFAAIAYDQIRNDDFKNPDPGWDVAVSKDKRLLNHWANMTDEPTIVPSFALSVSVKSSRLPKGDDIYSAIQRRDFKIFNLNNNQISLDLTADIETQVYYELEKTQLHNLQVMHRDVVEATLDRKNCKVIDEKLMIHFRYSQCILSRWNFSQDIITKTNMRLQKNQGITWSSFGKSMWIAPLLEGYSFQKIGILNDKLSKLTVR
ncbi:hypothetical protein [Xenorhabdus ishibashii]|uniref:Uncharacterized protein n=1 Tax=Xenorhabdus ishibashii TaxID=1034471 RepID=A0A2D0KHP5_9GAMM|nr:hypothetical protein [Xenorhabdus ishibashii]PHM62953.1 hypothetical protein Xish_02176 [Xenorhabdus ishibashii]